MKRLKLKAIDKNKRFTIVSLGFKAYEALIDPLASIACIYEDDNKNQYC